MNKRNRSGGFTLIELMVVIAIVALLVAMLLPSLQAARQHAKALSCSSNMHNIGVAMGAYLFSSKGTYPASYLYPSDEEGNWNPKTQSADKPFGYLHWSYFMFEGGQVSDKAFQCPVYDNGGAPRTNPGREEVDWQGGEQVDDSGQSVANELTDKQAPRMAYTANAVIMPRNKFTGALSEGPRTNVFIKDSAVKYPGSTVLATEFLNSWKAIGVSKGANLTLSKSHRPINPFFHSGSGFDEYAAAPEALGFWYGTDSDKDTFGLEPLANVRNRTDILDSKNSGIAPINAIGRHHPNANTVYAKKYGGTSNFLYCDGHAELMTALDSYAKRQWGTHYYSLTGENKVLNMSKDVR